MDSPDAGAKAGTSDPAPGTADRIRRRLLAFYDEDRRDLPWRGVNDPYRTWVSEIMLQQTRVETVIPYYRRWVERFPSVRELADAELDQVLQQWKGLGYYSRARNLHRAARMVRERHGGALPSSPEELRALPGIGEYTAGAVASIAFGVPAPAVDGNARRVLSRLFDLADPRDAELRRLATALVDRERPGAFNQAVMELGARICVPTDPNCGTCPVEALCLARERGTASARPAPKKRPRMGRAKTAVAVPLDDLGRTLLVRRPDDGLLGGMWEFPSSRMDGDDGGSTARKAARSAGVRLAAEAAVLPLEPVPHTFSHLRMTYEAYVFPASVLPEEVQDGRRILSLDALDDAPLPVAQQKIGVLARHAAG